MKWSRPKSLVNIIVHEDRNMLRYLLYNQSQHSLLSPVEERRRRSRQNFVSLPMESNLILISIYGHVFFYLECILLKGLLHCSPRMAIRKRRPTQVSATTQKTLAMGATQIPTERPTLRERPNDP